MYYHKIVCITQCSFIFPRVTIKIPKKLHQLLGLELKCPCNHYPEHPDQDHIRKD